MKKKGDYIMKKNVPTILWEGKIPDFSEYLRLYIQKFKGRLLVHLRIWIVNDNGELRPTKRGVTLPIEEIDVFRKGLRKAKKKLESDTSGANKRNTNGTPWWAED